MVHFQEPNNMAFSAKIDQKLLQLELKPEFQENIRTNKRLKKNRREIAKKIKVTAVKQNKKSNANTKVKNLTFKVQRSYREVEKVDEY